MKTIACAGSGSHHGIDVFKNLLQLWNFMFAENVASANIDFRLAGVR